MNASAPPGAPAPRKIELGGGKRPRGEGYVNLDLLPGADVVCDLERQRWPLEDGSVDEVYSSHFLEHVEETGFVLRELARVCRLGARVELRVPHWNQSMALCRAHRCTVSPTQVRHWTRDFVEDWFGGQPRRLKLLGTEFVPGEAFAEAKDLLGWFTDEQIMRLVPDACHEVRYLFEVIANG